MCLQALIPIASTALSVAGSIMRASQDASAAKARARVQERQAEIARDAGAFNMSKLRRRQKRGLGLQIAGTAARGLSLNSGSALAGIDDDLTESELDIEAARYNAERSAFTHKAQAAIHRADAKATMTSGYFSALSPLINTAKNIASSSSPSGGFGMGIGG